MKKIIFIFILLPFLGKAQVYQAGTVFSYYYDVTPDSVINYRPPSSLYSLERFYFDANSDMINDFEMRAYSSNAGAMGSDFIEIKSLSGSSYIRFGRLDSVYHSYQTQFWWVTKVAEPLNSGDTLNNTNAVWDTVSMSLTDDSYNFGADKNVYDWLGPNDKYIGLKYQNSIDTIYGWIRVNCPNLGAYNYECKLRDFSFQSTSIGIREYTWYERLKIYPTPTSDKVEFVLSNSSSDLEIRLYNSLGQIVLEDKRASSNKFTLDVSNYANGLYYVEVESKEGISRAKFVKINHEEDNFNCISNCSGNFL
ncbi:MAG: T9SS type A sorting domain-containing protein [Sphingobacteriaceae bacterium]|nr:T9SS type A sorting domain-containing protein [Sphingobacteriaceae bacterium]